MRTLAHDADTNELLERLGRLLATNQRRWGRMSAHQMICHMADTFRMALDEKAARDVSTPLSRTVVKWIALRLPFPWPPGIQSSREMDQELGGTRPGNFEADLRETGELLRRMAAAPAVASRRHPVFGDLTWDDWLRWGYLHTDHHLRQFGA